MDAIQSLCQAFGLSGAAGLNAYIPLLVVGVMQNRGLIHLAPPYDALGNWWCIALLIVLLALEIVVDKVPGADHVNDIVQTIVRPAAGVVLFLASVGAIKWMHPAVWIVLALLLTGAVHGAKALSRPAINLGTIGLGAPVASAIEDLVSVVLSITAMLAPAVAVALLFVFGWILWKLLAKFFRAKRLSQQKESAIAVQAIPVGECTTGNF